MADQYVYRFGPDQVLPASKYHTTEADGTVLIKTSKIGPASKKPESVYTFFKNVVDNYPGRNALAVKKDGYWHYYTYADYYENVKTVSKGLIKLGLERHYGVCIMGFNSPQWMFSLLGTIFAGGISAGVYTTNSPDACRHVASNCRAQIAIVESQLEVDKFLSIKRFLPDLKLIIQWKGPVTSQGVISWDELMAIGRNQSDDDFNETLSLLAVNQCCNLIYTSGTTGLPKGVMCSHDNVTWAAKIFVEYLDAPKFSNSISYLPLAHNAGMMVDVFGAIASIATVYFAQPDALKGSLLQTLQEVQPSAFLAVPRIWEKMYEKIQEAAQKAGFLKRNIGSWARFHGANSILAELEDRNLSYSEWFQTSLANALVLGNVRKLLGFENCKIPITGTAPLSKHIVEFFISFGLPLLDLYGLSETLSLGSCSKFAPGKYKVGTAGKVLSELLDLKLINVGEYRPNEGEILIKGRNIMMGYLRMPEKTKEAIDDDCWFHSGDLGYIDEDNFLFITGRLKELVITAGGENIPPVLIENAVKSELSFISNCMLIGDRRKYLTMLLTLKSELDDDTNAPLDQIAEECLGHFQDIGVEVKTVTEAVNDVKNRPNGQLANAINQGIERYNRKAISNAQKIQRWTILPHDFSVPTGELNTTLKYKRSFICDKYASLIEKMYPDNPLLSKI